MLDLSSLKWIKGEDFIDHTPRYVIQDHEYGNSYYRFQLVITSERIKQWGGYKLFYFPYVYDRNCECCHFKETKGIPTIAQAKKIALQHFEDMILRNGGNLKEVSKF